MRLMFVLLIVASTAGAWQYPKQVRNNYVSACMNYRPRSQCVCQIDYIQTQFSIDEFSAVERRMRAGASTSFDISVLKTSQEICADTRSTEQIESENRRIQQENNNLDRQIDYWERERQKAATKRGPKY